MLKPIISLTASALGNVLTIVALMFFDQIEFGDYKLIDGKIQVSDAAGFGMKLLI